ncbi:MAG: multicopper oxidase domain-containing protein, partial [Gemmatimonadota bacterium]
FIAVFLLVSLAAVALVGYRTMSPTPPPPATHHHYVAADPVDWDYAPTGGNLITGEDFSPLEQVWMGQGADRVGRVYRKALYRAYTDSTFTHLAPRPPEWEHLGALGPLLRGAVGDTILVHFRNNLPFPASVHPHGVFYDKGSEGAPSADGTPEAQKGDDAVPPGGSHTYVWSVPERAGPAEHDPSSILWMYHSHVNEDADLNAGLIGPIIVTRREDATAGLRPQDVDREFVVAFNEYDENMSHFLEHNIETYTDDAPSVPREEMFFWTPFGGSNFMETLNGYTFGHIPNLTMREGERVRWYLMANTNFEIHAPHWHGNVVTLNGMRTDVTSLITMGMQVADMVPDNPGKWMFHCHVNVHLQAGMQGFFEVLPRATEMEAAGD